MNNKKTVLVFGVFDGLHEGHRYFLRTARAHGERLVAVVARDAVAARLKGREPRQSQQARMRALEAEETVDEVVLGDEADGAWSAVRTVRPGVIALGYDQALLRTALEAHLAGRADTPVIVTIPAYQPERYHSSIMSL